MLIKDMENDQLRDHYWSLRALAYNNAQIAQRGNRRRAAAQMGRLMRHIEICEAVADRRGISLAKKNTD
jgi:hypothetical protein